MYIPKQKKASRKVLFDVLHFRMYFSDVIFSSQSSFISEMLNDTFLFVLHRNLSGY